MSFWLKLDNFSRKRFQLSHFFLYPAPALTMIINATYESGHIRWWWPSIKMMQNCVQQAAYKCSAGLSTHKGNDADTGGNYSNHNLLTLIQLNLSRFSYCDYHSVTSIHFLVFMLAPHPLFCIILTQTTSSCIHK